ncbi:MAG TPA: galactose-1-phosphate uridylyltransferase [Candidatus Eisenbacteria bacterium]|nr:galactose-1-phosphate uridylyltransferase [Candidatus Eisenbacteria bacterium]
MTYKLEMKKPDGRALILYGDEPFPEGMSAPQPPGPPVRAHTQLRWHPFRGEWVAYASHRQERTFLPPPGWDPLGPTEPGGEPTELPSGAWKIAVFENRFPSLAPEAPAPDPTIVETRPGTGVCEVVVYTPNAVGSLGELPLARLELLLEVWADRTQALGAREHIAYVMPFENRGAEVGATLAHPHGQIYAYPFVPPIPARELEEQAEHFAKHGRGLLEDHLQAELREGKRVLWQGEEALSFVPAFARYPYEAWVAPLAPAPSLSALTGPQRHDLAVALRDLVLRYDAVRHAPFPYVMVVHQAPTDGTPHPEAHVHFEFYPLYRSPERLKYLAGTEIGAGMFTNDSLPEAKAAELQALASEPARRG